jgi:hypothetical protein
MNKIYNTYKASEETTTTGEIIKEYLEFCKKENIKTGYHQKLETTIVSDWWLSKFENLKSFNRTSALALLASVRGMIEGEKGKCKAHTFYEGLCYECSDKKERNNVVQNLLSSIKLAEQQIQQ